MNACVRVVMGLLVLGLGAAGCEVDAGNPTKRGQCMRLGLAYCDRASEVGCQDTSGCPTQIQQQCDSAFDAKCRATNEDITNITHDVNNIIGTKETCESLVSVTGYLDQTLATMAASPCS